MTDMNQLLGPFQAINGPNASTVSIAATVASSSVALPAAAGDSGNPQNFARTFAVWNSGSTFAFVAFGPNSSVAATVPNGATAGSFPISPGSGYNGPPATITVAGNPTYVAAIMASSTGTIYICPGNGGGA
jgi:hypothetical protein